jgi:putative ABC transport system permease protein
VAFYRQLLERLRNTPGVQNAGASVNLPLGASGYSLGRAFIPDGRPLNVDESINASYATVTPGYFETMQIRLLAGRSLNDRDDENTPKVTVVNRTLAVRVFGSEQAALGKRITVWRDEKFPREIVGVVGDTKPSALDREAGSQIYVPHAQEPSWGFMAVVVRTTADAAAFTPTLRREVLAIDKDQPVFNVKTMEDAVLNSMGARRVSALLFTVFAGAALLLAAVGIYGVMAYSVTQRTQEIGIRMALGAQAGDVLRMVVRQGMTLTLLGVAAGLAGAFALTRVIASLLFDVSASDPTTFFGLSLLLLSVAFLACYLPARRAAKLDPMKALARG